MGKRFIELIKYFYECFIETLFPHINQCICCGEESSEVICDKCNSKINYITGKIKLKDFDEYVYPCCYYGHEIKKLVLEFKYGRDFYIGEKLGNFIVEKIKFFEDKNWVLTYIPSSKKSIKDRGFDQCKFLAEYIEHETGIVAKKYLIKDDNVKEQKRLSHKERIDNLKEAFQSSQEVVGSKIILIDDVITTGATLFFAKKALIDAGAKKVLIIAVAKSTI